jgi:tetratricopeptide (TPR) repeat protein
VIIRLGLLLALLAAACSPLRTAHVPGGFRLSPADREAWDKAGLLAASGRRTEAIRMLEGVSKRSPRHVPSRLLLQDLQLERDGPGVVMSRSDAQVRLHPDDWIARLLLIRLEPDPGRRLSRYKELRRKVPRDPWTHLAVADAAVAVSERAAKVVVLARQRGTVEDRRRIVEAEHVRDEALDEAREAVAGALSVDSLLVPALRRRGDVLGLAAERAQDPGRRRSLTDEQLAAYDEALGLASGDLPTLVARAAVHRRRNDYAAAKRDLMRAIKLRPWDPDVHQNLGVVAYEAGEFILAERAFRDAVKLEPRSADSHRNLGDTLAAREQWRGAIGVYERALGFAPESPELLERLGNVHARLGETDEALAYYRRYLATDGPQRTRVETAMRRLKR